MKAEELRKGITVCHTKYGRCYIVVESNCRMKDSIRGWIDCVIYAPLYSNNYNMFAREKVSFLEEFEVVDTHKYYRVPHGISNSIFRIIFTEKQLFKAYRKTLKRMRYKKPHQNQNSKEC